MNVGRSQFTLEPCPALSTSIRQPLGFLPRNWLECPLKRAECYHAKARCAVPLPIPQVSVPSWRLSGALAVRLGIPRLGNEQLTAHSGSEDRQLVAECDCQTIDISEGEREEAHIA